jgi:hypothetical protein
LSPRQDIILDIKELRAEYLADISTPSRQDRLGTQYLVENATGKGASGKWMLDTFDGNTLTEFKIAIREICKLTKLELELEIEAYDPIMKEYIPIRDGLRGLTRCALIRVVRTT